MGIFFANDFDNLIPIDRNVNRSKSNSGIVEWISTNEYANYFYIKKWKFIKEKYSIPFAKEEIEIFKKYNIIQHDPFEYLIQDVND